MTDTTPSKAAPRIVCIGQCGKSWADADEAEKAGIEFFAVARGYRCGQCSRALALSAQLARQAESPFRDELPSGSRGALPKETAYTIIPSRVKP